MEPEPEPGLSLLLLWRALPAERKMRRALCPCCCLGCPGLLTAFELPLAIANGSAAILEFVVCVECAAC